MEESVKQLKKLPLRVKEFPANGKRYVQSESISFSSWNRYEELQLQLMYAFEPSGIQVKLGEVYNLLNEGKMADAAVHLHNIRVGIEEMTDETRRNPALKMCALFMFEENEDQTLIVTPERMEQKIRDWEVEGYDMDSFFAKAIASSPSLLKIFHGITQGTLQVKEGSLRPEAGK